MPEPLHPFDWNFSSCPKDEIPYLYFYEYAREFPRIIEAVETIRRSHRKPKFDWHDWPKWPQRPYLLLPQHKRKHRLKALKALPDDLIFTIRIVPLLGKDQRLGWLSLDFQVTERVNPNELIAAMASYVQLYWTNREQLMRPRSTGRAAAQAHFWTRLRALSVYRLRRHYTAAEALGLHQKAWRPVEFNSGSAMNRARHKTKVYLDVFSEMASLRMKSGRWFPPFAEIRF